jgi:quercetin dioxygenase-like cupin family protein
MPVLVQNVIAAPDARASAGPEITSLFNGANIGSDHVVVDYLHLAQGKDYDCAAGTADIVWLYVLQGEGMLGKDAFSTAAVASLLPGSGATLRAQRNMEVLVARVPDAARFDPNISDADAEIKITNWRREPVLQSEHDARTRIYMATPALSGTTAIKGEMVTYPPGTEAPQHHHEGAEHFQYIVSGSGTAVLDGTPHQLSSGDILYNYENEPHYFYNEADNAADFCFVEFFVPGECKTVWAPDANLCAWLPTGRDIAGQKPVREIAYHVHGEDGGI